MINLLITVFGIVLVILGFYSMSFGFSTPPDLRFFFIGLFSTVIGVILIIFFGSQINRDKSESTPLPKEKVRDNEKRITSKAIPKEIKPKPSRAVKEPSEKKPKEEIKRLVTSEKPSKADEVPKKPRKIKPKKVSDVKKPEEVKKAPEPKENVASPPKEDKKPEAETIKPITAKPVQKNIKKSPSPLIKDEKEITEADKPVTPKKEKIKPQSIVGKRIKPVSRDDDDEFVKNRLDRLKANYIQNAKDIENLIEERLDSFKGTLNQIKSESKDPSIIWSFDAGDVQETMQETILKANEKILMMYPWVRNIEVSSLKKFMETESKMIIQEASLDDDASVELIKLLMDNNVKIRTMPHVHTVAIVADAENGLIISTDPIYESFEVGVIYKDMKSIEEIERMFDEAWKLSKDINLEINA